MSQRNYDQPYTLLSFHGSFKIAVVLLRSYKKCHHQVVHIGLTLDHIPGTL